MAWCNLTACYKESGIITTNGGGNPSKLHMIIRFFLA